MIVEFRMPEMGESVHAIEVGEVLVKVGDQIEADRALLEIETEKARVELPSPHAGKVTGIHVATGDPVAVGTLLVTLDCPHEARDVSDEQVNEPQCGDQERGKGRFGIGAVQRIPLSPLQCTAADQMERSARLIPQATHHDEADITELEAWRAAIRSRQPITLTAVLINFCARLLKEMPLLNSSFDRARSEVIIKPFCHVGIAVDTPHGLVVPVLRDADRQSLDQIAVALARLADRARQRSLTLEELRDATFTITNQGRRGGTGITPLVNYPQAAILGVGRATWRPVFIDKTLERRLVLPIALAFDHRIITGADAARFCERLIAQLQTVADS